MREQIQKKAVDTFLDSGMWGILQIAQRVGKIKIALDILTEIIEDGVFVSDTFSILVAYPDNRIKDSWETDIKKWRFKYGDNITFCNYSSIWKYEEKHFSIVVLDEIHATSENQRQSIDKITDLSPHCLGLSGTISNKTEDELRNDLFLEVLMKYTVEDAIRDGIIAPYSITVHITPLDRVHKSPNKKGKMVTEKQKYDTYTHVFEKLKLEGRDFKFIVLHRNRVLQGSISKRTKTINLIKKFQDKRTLVFTGLKKIAESLGIPFYHSTSDDDTVFDQFKDKTINQLAVVNIGRAGVTFPDLDVIIISSFTGNEETTEQIIARALNKDTEEKIADIHIICSDEPAEVKKLKQTLINFDQNNIHWK
jgi:superfamily II DNA or RNA helicase